MIVGAVPRVAKDAVVVRRVFAPVRDEIRNLRWIHTRTV